MPNNTTNNIKLGIFVMSGLAFLILLLYMIGKNTNLFQSSYVLKSRMLDAQGLMAGNNVRFAGIESGTVKRIAFVNDSVLEVTMLVDTKMKNIIRKNAIVSIGTEGLVGSKVVNIVSSGNNAPFAQDGDILPSAKGVNTSEMLSTLNNTNQDVAVFAAELKSLIKRLNRSEGIWTALESKKMAGDLISSAANVQAASKRAAVLINELDEIIANVKAGNGTAGAILTDTTIGANIRTTTEDLKVIADKTDQATSQVNELLTGINSDIKSGKGTVNALLKDSSIVIKLNATLDNIVQGTDRFNQNMEALKHNVLFRGYFRKLDKQKRKSAAPKNVANR